MNELIQRLKHVRSIMLVIPDTPVKGVRGRVKEAVDMQQGIIDDLLRQAHNQAITDAIYTHDDEVEPVSVWEDGYDYVMNKAGE